MESLALTAALVMLSVWALAALAVALSFLGWRLVGSLFGGLSVAAGAWLIYVLPHAPWLGAINLLAGSIAIVRAVKLR